MIRPATEADLPAVCSYWNPLIRDTIVTFSSEERTPAGLAATIAERRAKGWDFWVAEAEPGTGTGSGPTILGHVTYAQFRAGNGYARAMEHTVILGPGARGRGLGRAMMAVLEDHARAAGVHAMIGGVSAENAAGRAFHAAIGYGEVARVPQVGHKFGRWHDLLLMQKIL
ncbi:GNAT family N-acetyltransferase [Frigidibacter sp. MR17.24]|uniref:GNAT family N-acetyltransferase n=1 Tax=Frigidibacter sp. MR17.24 TaxID=3127345 RepID=UPI003012B990